jgi:hypothetical protein
MNSPRAGIERESIPGSVRGPSSTGFGLPPVRKAVTIDDDKSPMAIIATKSSSPTSDLIIRNRKYFILSRRVIKLKDRFTRLSIY